MEPFARGAIVLTFSAPLFVSDGFFRGLYKVWTIVLWTRCHIWWSCDAECGDDR